MGKSSQPTVQDCEDALRSMVDQLYIMYTQNGGEEASRTVMQLLKNIHRLSPWLEDIAKQAEQSDGFWNYGSKLREQMKPVLEVVKEKGVGNGKES